MDDFIGLDLDPAFRGFFYCSIWDPSLAPRSGPSESALYKMVYLARKGNVDARFQFVNTMDWTLRPETLECFQRLHGPRPIRFEHWFYAKLEQLLSILLYEKLLVYPAGGGDAKPPKTDRPWEEGDGLLTGTLPAIQPDDLERAFSPGDSTADDWWELVTTLAGICEDRMAAFQQLIDNRIEERAKGGGSGGETGEGQTTRVSQLSKRHRRRVTIERNSIICYCLDQGLDRFEICVRLDAKGIRTTPKMAKHGHSRWTDAWEDPEFQPNVQQVFSKAKSGR